MSKYVDAGDIDLDEEIVLDSRGNRITEAKAEEMAEDAIAYLDKLRGRPALTRGRAGRSPEVKARVPEQLRERLLARADREHKNPSTLIREALEKYLETTP